MSRIGFYACAAIFAGASVTAYAEWELVATSVDQTMQHVETSSIVRQGKLTKAWLMYTPAEEEKAEQSEILAGAAPNLKFASIRTLALAFQDVRGTSRLSA